MFKDPRDIVRITKFNIDRSSHALTTPAECTIDVTGNDQFYGTLRLLQKVSKYQQVLITWLSVHSYSSVEELTRRLKYGEVKNKANTSTTDDPESNGEDFEGVLKEMLDNTNEETEALKIENEDDVVIDALIVDTVHISKAITSVRFGGYELSSASSSHIVNQLQDCDKIIELDLTGIKQVPEELGDAISVMTMLRFITIHGATVPVNKGLLSGLSHCHHLEEIYLQENTLTNCLEQLFDNSDHPGFQSLRVLELSKAELDEADLTSISAATRNDKLPELKQLHISNNTLTDGLSCLLDTDYPSLDWLWIDDTHLSKTDIKTLSEAVHDGKLQKLKDLNLSDNVLTSYMKDLLGEASHYGFHSLAHLKLKNTELHTDDLLCLTEAMKSGKLPKLVWLHLEGNNLSSMEDQVADLIQTAIKAYKKKELFLYLDNNGMSDECCERMESAAKGSKIHLKKSEDSYY